MKIITIEDVEYPKKLLDIKNPPKQLYVEGNVSLLNRISVAIVGSRKATSYGIKYAKEFASKISKENVTIISGLALGIDTVAHEFSKGNIGKTIAVLGGGFYDIYPRENKVLYKQILENGGAVISEYAPEEKVNTRNFPNRNRIISGISNGILVVEASLKSGSTITGRYRIITRQKGVLFAKRIGGNKRKRY